MTELNSSWTFWVEGRNVSTRPFSKQRLLDGGLTEEEANHLETYNYFYDLKTKYTFSTIESFWILFDSLLSPLSLSLLSPKHSIWLTRNRFLPIDITALAPSYSICFRLQKTHPSLDTILLDLYMAVVGEQVDVIALGVSERPTDILFTIHTMKGVAKSLKKVIVANGVKEEYNTTGHVQVIVM